jgi:carbamoyltransferase
MRILGISAYYHDSAAALIEDGRILAAAQEERFSRRKHDSGFPRQAIAYCLAESGDGLAAVDHVVFYDKPFLKFERLLETYLSFAPRGFTSFRMAMPVWMREKLFQKNLLAEELSHFSTSVNWRDRLLFSEHHLSHAASAFFPSPYEQAAILTMDGVGEWATTSIALGMGNSIDMREEIHFPHSLGLLYSAFTYYCGFKVNSGEYKLMGLAPYGEPRYAALIREKLIDIKPDGSFRLALDYFDYCTGLRMTNARFDALFGGPPRQPHELLEQRHMDLAASIQVVLEEAVLGLVRHAVMATGQRKLCLAGGVALNCVANGRILESGLVSDLWVQPAAGDAGGALGAALAGYHMHLGRPRTVAAGDAMAGSYLGPAFTAADIETRLTEVGAKFSIMDEDAMLQRIAAALAVGKAVGWFQGRMEFGPRALGGRSILADPRDPEMQKKLNLKVKYRESFRPFAPSVLREHMPDWFDLDVDSPYMLVVAGVRSNRRRPQTAGQQMSFGIERLNHVRSDIPAVTHLDYSARIQSVHAETNPLYHRLLKAFHGITGCPVLVNTSFNVRGEPIVGTPEDAFRCFMGTELDLLAVGNCVMDKGDQNPALKGNYATAFDLD